MDFYLHTNDQISLGCFQAFHCDAIMGQMLYQFQGNQRDYFSNDTFRGRSLVSSVVYYEVTPPDTFPLRHIFGGVTDNSTANTLDNDNTSSSSSIVVEEDEAPQIVSSLAEQVATEPNSLVLNENADEFVQEDVADFDGNVIYNAPLTPMFEEAESSSTYQDTSNMHEFHQKHHSSDKWTKNHLVKQVIVSTIEPKNIKEVMLDVSWIESKQDELNQFKRLDVWELSRLVAKGYGQEKGIDFEESFAPVARLEDV
ncbi:hypothetical protein Tco_1335703 [Tanacetum coccineum]